MNQCSWEPINNFASLSEFHRFFVWMNDQINNGLAEEISVNLSYLGATTFEEKWFKHVGTGQIWRLVWPDWPFHGVFERVIESKNSGPCLS